MDHVLPRAGLTLLFVAIVLVGCNTSNPSAEPDTNTTREGSDSMKITSPAFDEDESIPERHTCDGEDVSPPLSLNAVPENASSLALIVDDPDAPGGTFVHWVIWNLPSDLDAIPGDVPTDRTLSSLGDAHQGENDFGSVGYRGPCPPPGPPHHYRFQLHALDRRLDLSPGASKKDLTDAMDEAILAEDTLTGLYSR